MIYIYILNFCSLIINSIFIKKYLHIFQLKDYSISRYFKFFNKNKLIYHVFVVFLLFFQIILKNFLFLLLSNLIAISVSPIYNFRLLQSNKTPLVKTAKIKRLFTLSVLILIIPCLFKYGVLISFILLLFTPIISNFINIYDKIKNKKFINHAQKKLRRIQPKIIAITGSNGKTSIKNFLQILLSQSYVCQATPKSYNTPLGISKFVNENLREDCKFLILEYGARRRGDIKKLCKIFGANYGIVSTVAPQHLESFKSVENIYKTKKELPDFLKENLCIYSSDNIYAKRMFDEKVGAKIQTSILSKTEIHASNITYKNFKTQFVLHINNNSCDAEIDSLGKHNVANILECIALAINLGVDKNKILNSLSLISAVPHRLQHIKGRLNILDDSYNCSLSSAKESIEVLSFQSGKKMIITPGIIEGGKFQHLINVQLGKLFDEIDFCVVVGETNKSSIIEGIKSLTSPPQVFCSPSLEDASQHFKLLNEDDTILFLNDLPDDYK